MFDKVIEFCLLAVTLVIIYVAFDIIVDTLKLIVK